MKLHYTFKFFDTEDAAREFVDRENHEHPRRKNKATYTTWSSSPTAPVQFIVWYYI